MSNNDNELRFDLPDDELEKEASNNQIVSKPSFISKIKSKININLKKLFSFIFIIGLILSAVLFSLSDLWDKPAKLFLTSYAEMGLPIFDLKKEQDFEYFFENSRLAKKIVTLRKITVNIKSSSHSSSNPMLAFEIGIEGLSTEAIVEIKDREAEMVDIVARTAEEFTYDDLSEPEGKKKLSDQLSKEINANLTTGQVRGVFYSSFILKY